MRLPMTYNEKLNALFSAISHSHIPEPMYLLSSCQSSGPIKVSANKGMPVASQPHEFVSPIEKLRSIQNQIILADENLPRKINFKSDSWINLMDLSQTYETLEAEQEAVDSELEQ